MKPNGLWIFYPILFGLIGGIIAYFRIINKDKDLATALWIVLIIVIFLIFYPDFI